MKRYVISLFVVCLLCTSVFAGSIGPKDVDRHSDNPYVPPGTDQRTVPPHKHKLPKNAITKLVEEKVMEELAKNDIGPNIVAPSEGFALGIHGIYPEVSYDFGLMTLGVGYTSVLDDQSGLIRGSALFYSSDDMLTEMSVGVAMFPGNGPLYGMFVKVEQFITHSVSVSGAIYGLKSGNDQTIISEGVLGAKLYI